MNVVVVPSTGTMNASTLIELHPTLVDVDDLATYVNVTLSAIYIAETTNVTLVVTPSRSAFDSNGERSTAWGIGL